MSELVNIPCIPCQGGVPPLSGDKLKGFIKKLGGDWKVVRNHHLEKEFTFPDFTKALAFVDEVGALAEEVGHHPTLELSWGKVKVTIWTHKINGLADADFVFAAKTDALFS